jgi:hypothetical protein
MSKARRIQAALLFVGIGGAAWYCAVQHVELDRLRIQAEASRQRLDRVTQLENDNARLSNLVAQTEKPAASITDRQLTDLLRLRNEVGMLRRQTNELEQLRTQNEQLQAASRTGRSSTASGTTNLPGAEPPLAVFPKDSWAFMGYATPEDAFQSLNWAALNGDVATLRSNLTLDAQNEFAKSFEHDSEAEIREKIMQKFSEKTEARILGKDVINDSFVVLRVSGGGKEDDQDKLIFQRVNGQWKFVSDH